MEKTVIFLLFFLLTLKCFPNYVIYPSYPLIEKLILSEYSLMATTEFILKDERDVHNKDLSVHGLQDIGRFIEEMEVLHQQIGQQTRSYSKHPINVFYIIKRMSATWKDITSKIKQSNLCETNNKMKKQLDLISGDLLPKEALTDIALDLVSLQSTYGIPITDMVNGIFNDERSLHQLTVEDTFLLARRAYDAGLYAEAILWAKYTRDVCTRNKEMCLEKYEINVPSPYNLMAHSYFRLHKPKEAVEVLDELLVIDPTNSNAKRNKVYFMQSSVGRHKEDRQNVNSIFLSNKSQDLCRGKQIKPARQQAKLVCYYFPTEKMFIFEKVEVFNRKPAVYMFHDVFPWKIVAKMRGTGYELISHGLKNQVHSLLSNVIEISDSRVKKWEETVKRRLEDLKGLLYKPYKYFTYKAIVMGPRFITDKKITREQTENIGFFQIYLSDGDDFIGGSTVFPQHNVRVEPKTGSVLFWYESKSTATVCPVLYGHMWIARNSIEEISPETYCRPR